MTARLNKYWRIWALASAIARQLLTGFASFNNVKELHGNKQAIVPNTQTKLVTVRVIRLYVNKTALRKLLDELESNMKNVGSPEVEGNSYGLLTVFIKTQSLFCL